MNIAQVLLLCFVDNGRYHDITRLCHFQRHKSGKEKEKKSGNTRKPLVFFIFM